MASTAPFVPTVRGPIAPEELGVTLMHEHLTIDLAQALLQPAPPIGSRGALTRIEQCLQQAWEAGTRTFVDVGTQQFGPSPLLLLAVAARTPMHIVSAIGCFPLDQMPAPTWAYPPTTAEQIGQRLIAWAEEGVDGSGVRPGIIKLGTGVTAISELEQGLFRGAAAAQRRTGLAITTHTHQTRLAEEQVSLLADAGADLDRVVIGHVGWGTTREDRDRHVALAERGVTLGLDLIGLPDCSLEEYADIAIDLIEAGHAERIILSQDAVAVSRGLFEIFGDAYLEGDFTIIARQFVPLLRERGVDDATIQQLLVENPRRILTIDPARYPETTLGDPPAPPAAIVPFDDRR